MYWTISITIFVVACLFHQLDSSKYGTIYVQFKLNLCTKLYVGFIDERGFYDNFLWVFDNGIQRYWFGTLNRIDWYCFWEEWIYERERFRANNIREKDNENKKKEKIHLDAFEIQTNVDVDVTHTLRSIAF